THSPFYLIVSAFVPYKRIDIAIEAFNRSKLSLKIIGSGPDFRKLKNRAQENIEFLGWKSETELRDYYQRCEAVLFTGEEDCGIVPIEAMSCGKPVLAYRKGGACETVIEEKTGIFFNEPTVESFLGGLQKLQTRRWDVPTIRGRALQFSKERFLREITELILNKTRDTFDLSRYIS
ncbi:MAG: glycosyltransferase, partial [Elusimicrobia bacterium]|nr:glycosyltransferase [Elusimicrobiota bacterium]